MTLKIKDRAEIQARLTKAGLIAHVQAPNQRKNFQIEIKEGRRSNSMIITPGKCDLKVFPDPKNSQAILWADEEGRTETRDVTAYVRHTLGGKLRDERLEEIVKEWKRGRHFGMRLPEGTKYKVLEGPNYKVGGRAEGKVQAVVPKSELTLLVGKDETAHFVSALPERVKTVREAHEILRPADVPKGSLRQGEWFFVPVTDEERKRIEDRIERNPLEIEPLWLDGIRYNPDSRWSHSNTTHAAHSALLFGGPRRGTVFATGYVLDDRRQRGQKIRHEPLWLHDWHRVVHNAEVDMGDAQAETWD